MNETSISTLGCLEMGKLVIPNPNTRKYLDHTVSIANFEEEVYLRSSCYPVNMRLFQSSPEYRQIILLQCQYLKMLSMTIMQGYTKPFGASAAAAGLSFNIICVVRDRGFTSEYPEIMINPKIVHYSDSKVTISSNSGVLNLKKNVDVERSEMVKVAFYDENGKSRLEERNRQSGSLTIQHECENNLGILLIDK